MVTFGLNFYTETCPLELGMSMPESNEQNKEHSKVSVRIGEFQVELEGTHGNVKKLMGEELFDFIKGLQETTKQLPPSTEVTPEVSPEEEAVPPLGRPSTTMEALSQLFKTEWGRKPRQLSEIMQALEANGLYYKKPVVAKVLVDLIKKKELRRLGTKGTFQYVAV
jgi:hypothetical protein